MNFVVNNLIKWFDDPKNPKTERILYVEPSGNSVAAIDVENDIAVPVWRKRDDIVLAFEMTRVVLLNFDEFAAPVYSDEELKLEKKYEIIRKKRDKAYKIIAPLVKGENAVRVLLSRERAILIQDISLATGVSRQTIYLYLRRWWQGGQTINALLAHYMNCGGRGKERLEGKIKRGRKTIITIEEGYPTGTNVDKNWKAIIELGGRLFFNNRRRPNWTKAHKDTLRLLCRKNSEEQADFSDPKKNKIISVGQFKYHFNQYRAKKLKESIIAREGETSFNLEHRGIEGNSTEQAIGPGSLYQIDATIGDVNMRSRLVPTRIIGRPVIYILMDVFSRMIVGICIRLEGEGWLGVRLAIENATTDKVAFCAEYGIHIDKEHWRACYLPDEITGDRGPLESHFADEIPDGLDIDVSNTPPTRLERHRRTSLQPIEHPDHTWSGWRG